MKFVTSPEWESWTQANGVAAVYLFGSQTRVPRPDSDVDLGIVLAKSPPWEEGERVREEAAPYLARALACPEEALDVRLLNDAPPGFRYTVVSARQLLWEGDRALRIAFERETAIEYLDFQYYEEIHHQAMLRRLEEGTFGRRPAVRTPPPG